MCGAAHPRAARAYVYVGLRGRAPDPVHRDVGEDVDERRGGVRDDVEADQGEVRVSSRGHRATANANADGAASAQPGRGTRTSPRRRKSGDRDARPEPGRAAGVGRLRVLSTHERAPPFTFASGEQLLLSKWPPRTYADIIPSCMHTHTHHELIIVHPIIYGQGYLNAFDERVRRWQGLSAHGL